jgi:hypothetical protein
MVFCSNGLQDQEVKLNLPCSAFAADLSRPDTVAIWCVYFPQLGNQDVHAATQSRDPSSR